MVLTRATLAALCRARTSVTQGTFVCLGPHPPKTKSVVFKSTWAFGGSHCCGVCRSPCAHRSYCPAGSSFPEPIQLGYFGTGSVNPETFSGESPCPPGFYCANALKNPCPVRFACVRLLLGYFPVVRSPPHAALPFPVCVCVSIQGGNYGEEPELTSSECNGPCSAGYFCPPGSTSATEKEVRVCLPISSVHLDPPFSSPSPLSVFIAVWSQHGDSQHGVLPCPQYEPFFAFAVLLWLRLTSLLPRLPTHRRESGPLLHRGFTNDAHRRSSVPRRQLLCQRHAV